MDLENGKPTANTPIGIASPKETSFEIINAGSPKGQQEANLEGVRDLVSLEAFEVTERDNFKTEIKKVRTRQFATVVRRLPGGAGTPVISALNTPVISPKGPSQLAMSFEITNAGSPNGPRKDKLEGVRDVVTLEAEEVNEKAVLETEIKQTRARQFTTVVKSRRQSVAKGKAVRARRLNHAWLPPAYAG